jgi:Ribosomal protein L11 methylase
VILPPAYLRHRSPREHQPFLDALDEQLRGDERLLDIGTDSGILAIAALELGAASAEGVDIDSAALRTAGENAALNGVQDHLIRSGGRFVR